MSPDNGPHSKDLEPRGSDLDSNPSNPPSWRARQVEGTGRPGDSSTTPPSSASLTTRGFQTGAQQDERSRSWNHAAPNLPQNHGSASESTQSSPSTDGGVPLNIEYSPVPRRLSPAQNNAASADFSEAEPSDVQSQTSKATLSQVILTFVLYRLFLTRA